MERMRIKGHESAIPKLLSWVRKVLHGLDGRQMRRIELAIEEASLNVIRHGGGSEMEVRLMFEDKGWKVEIRDEGISFDPRQEVQREGDIGGWGLTILKTCADKIDYRRDQGQNVFTMFFKSSSRTA